MDYIKFIVLVLHVFLFYGCNKVDNFENVDVIRFEKEFYDSDDKNLDSVINKYPFLFPNQFSRSIWLEKKSDSTEIGLYQKSLEVFDDFQFNSPKLKLIFKNAKENFNSFQTPKLISLISLGDYNDKGNICRFHCSGFFELLLWQQLLPRFTKISCQKNG